MDRPIRTVAKAVCWQLLGLVSMGLIGLVFTGSLVQGAGIALSGAVTGLATYVVHERVWARIHWGRS